MPAQAKQPRAPDYGSRVRKRRSNFASNLTAEESLSKAKARKLAKEQDKRFKDPEFEARKRRGALYSELLRATRDAAALEPRLDAALDALFPTGALALESAEVREAHAKLLCDSVVSRILQFVVKHGNAAQLDRLFVAVRPVWGAVAKNVIGAHVLVKLAKRLRNDKPRFAELVALSAQDEKLFFCKAGAKTVEALCLACSSAKVLRTFVNRLFFEKLFSALGPESEQRSIEDNLGALDDNLRSVLRNRVEFFVNKIVDKELVGNEVSLKYLQILLRAPCTLDAASLDALKLSLFEASLELLKFKTGVEILSHLCGRWTPKEKKKFCHDFAKALKLNELVLASYYANEVQFPFLLRLACCIDDAKLRTKYLLAPLAQAAPDAPELFAKFVGFLEVIALHRNGVNSYVLELIRLPSPKTLKPRSTICLEIAEALLAEMSNAAQQPELAESVKRLRALRDQLAELTDAPANLPEDAAETTEEACMSQEETGSSEAIRETEDSDEFVSPDESRST